MNILKNTAVILGLLLGFSTLFSYISKLMKDDVVASSRGGDFSLPITLEAHFQETGEEISEKFLEEKELLFERIAQDADRELNRAQREIIRTERELDTARKNVIRLENQLNRKQTSDEITLSESEEANPSGNPEIPNSDEQPEFTQGTTTHFNREDYDHYLRETNLDYEMSIPTAASRLTSFWNVQISNESGTTRNDVELYFPGAKVFTLSRDAGDPIGGTADELISIGRLRPDEKVQVSVWSSNSEQLISPNAFRSSEARVTHTTGIAKVGFPREATGWLTHLVDWSPVIIPTVSVLAIFLLISVSAPIILSVKKRYTMKSDTADPPEIDESWTIEDEGE